MKPLFKATLVLGATLIVGSITFWMAGRSYRAHESAASLPSSSPTNVPPLVVSPIPAIRRPVTAAPASLPAAKQPVAPTTPAATFAERVKRVHELPRNLSGQDIQAFLAYLAVPAASVPADRSRENWLRNEMMDKLVETPALPSGLVQVLVSIYQDPAQDVVMRDYAVQHMGPVYARAGAPEQAVLQTALWQAAEETASSVAGTALLVLSDLAPDYREFERGKLEKVALRLAGDDHCGELSRITALQVCGRLGLKEASPVMLQLARTAGSVPLQIAAIAALGDVGNEEARACLRQLAQQPEPRLEPALETALRKLNERLGT
jgi:hypothetical protein